MFLLTARLSCRSVTRLRAADRRDVMALAAAVHLSAIRELSARFQYASGMRTSYSSSAAFSAAKSMARAAVVCAALPKVGRTSYKGILTYPWEGYLCSSETRCGGLWSLCRICPVPIAFMVSSTCLLIPAVLNALGFQSSTMEGHRSSARHT